MAQARGERLLLVDANAAGRTQVAIDLVAEGFTVRCVDGTRQAFEAAAVEAPDVVLVELMLRAESGLDAVRALRARLPRAPAVLMSAYELSARQLLRAGCGAAGFVVRPCPGPDLARFLRQKWPPTV